MIRQSMDETELDRDSIFNQLRMKMSKVEIGLPVTSISSSR